MDQYKQNIDLVLSTGNITEASHINWVKSLSKQVIQVAGEEELERLNENSELKLFERVRINDQTNIGVINGFQTVPLNSDDALLNIMKEKDVDILITGNAIKSQVRQIREKIII